MISSLAIIGYGQFGGFIETLAMRFAPRIRVMIHSSRHAPDGGRFVSLEEACGADIVVAAPAIRDIAATFERVVPRLGAATILVDVATVKVHPVAELRRHAAARSAAGGPPLRYLATHPMFGPYSYARGEDSLSGLRIVLTDHSLEPEIHAAARTALQAAGLVILELSAEEHDRILAETLFLTHYIGQVVTHGGFLRTDIDTVSFGFLMDAVESVRQDTRLFQDVYRLNPYCRAVVDRFEAAERRVARVLREGDRT